MYNLYENIYALCNERKITPGALCGELGFRRSVLSDLKNGRKKSLDTTTLMKIAEYFNVSVDYLLTGEEIKKAPTDGERAVSDDDIKFALFGGDGEITDAMYDEVKRFAQMVKLREEAEKEKK
jgi:transcriptional regulator with XRE-family HTH domain|nr:MAG TPA: Cro/C1-type HTH DNA-binding domain protein [Caudoviricetes sp.]DAT04775.1 MAG TPA: Cro/C1-type HTH DNA-binding domain protein [Caudoviricetes sp.]